MRTTSLGLASSESKVNGGGAIGLNGVTDAAGFKRGLDLGEDCAQDLPNADCRWSRRQSRFLLPRRRPIFGRLVRSRSPPQPNSVMTRPLDAAVSLAGEGGEIAQRIVGVRVVDDHGEGLAGVDRLKAPRHGCELRDGCDELVKCNAARVGRREGRKQIQNVDFAGEMRLNDGRPGRCFELDCLRPPE